MKRAFFSLPGLCLVMLGLLNFYPLRAQTIIEGFSGISFTKEAESYTLVIEDTFNLHAMQVVPEALTLSWDAVSQVFSLYGSATLILTVHQFSISFGGADNPGIVISNDTLTRVAAGISAEFDLNGLEIHPDPLGLVWYEPDDSYGIFGNLGLKIEEDSLQASLGDTANPGILIRNGTIENINISVTAAFSLKSLAIKPEALSFVYDHELSQYKIYGDIEIDIEEDTVKAHLGDQDRPGISITDGHVDMILASVSSHFELKSLTIETDSLGIEWEESGDDDLFNFFGAVDITIDEDIIDFNFGNSSEPGLMLRNGKIDWLKISSTSDIHFAGFEAGTEDLTLQYAQDVYHLTGKIFLKKMWSAIIDLGDGPGSGVTLDVSGDEASLVIVHGSFELQDIDLGPVALKDLLLVMDQNEVQEASLKLDLPPGYEIDAMIRFIDLYEGLELDAIDIAWEATNFEEAIPIPGTGAFITHLEGGLFNIEEPHDFYIQGDIGVAFGGPFNVTGVGKVSLIYLSAETRISRSELSLKSDVLMGAYRDEDAVWQAVLGDGHLNLDLVWGDHYSFDGNLNIPSDPWTIMKADIEAKLSESGAFDAHVGVVLQVPPEIPVIGGYEFAEAEGLVHYDNNDPLSYAAGWAKLDLGFYTLQGGVRYFFQTHDYSTLGSKDIDQISNSQSVAATNPILRYWEYLKVDVGKDNPHFIQVKIKMKQAMPFFYIDVFYPLASGGVGYAPIHVVQSIDEVNSSGLNITSLAAYSSQYVYAADSVLFYILAPGYSNDSKATLPSAEYTIEISNNIYTEIVASHEIDMIFASPDIISSGFSSKMVHNYLQPIPWIWEYSTNLGLYGYVYDIDSTKLSVHLAKNRNENGITLYSGKLEDKVFYEDGTYFAATSDFDLAGHINPMDSIFLYTIVDDGINAPKKSEPSVMSNYVPLGGKVSIAGMPASAASGIELELWGEFEWYQHPKTFYKVNQVKIFTNEEGYFGFPYHTSTNTRYKILVDIPEGYELDPATHFYPGAEFNFYRESVWTNIDIILRKKQ